MAHVLSGLAYNRHVGPVVLAVVISLAAIGFRELVRFFNFILLERAWAWAEATPPYGRSDLYGLGGSGGAHRSDRLEHRKRREPGIAPIGAAHEDTGRLRRGQSTALIL
jgi:hypothetical protein